MRRENVVSSIVMARLMLVVLLLCSFLLLFTELTPLHLLVFLLVIFSHLLRWRFAIPQTWMLLDSAMLVVLSLLMPSLVLLLALYVYYFAVNAKLLYAFLLMLYCALVIEFPLLLFPIVCLMFGLILYFWDEERRALIQEADEQRQKAFQLDQQQQQLLLDYSEDREITRMQEREHIARILHDSLGHELTGAHLTIQAANALLLQQQQQRAGEAQKKVEQRLMAALDQLKLAVRQLQPEPEQHHRELAQLFQDFSYPVGFSIQGDLSFLETSVRRVLYTVVKEALTNIAKHANPREVTASIDINKTLARFVIENDGISEKSTQQAGNGLRYMRRRVEVLGGSMAIIKGQTFKLIVTLPCGVKEWE